MNSNYPPILIGTLFSEVKNYCIKEWFKNVCSFTYPNLDLCMVDNSKDKKYHKKILKYFSKHKKNSNIKNITILHTPRVDKSPEIFMTFSANELRKYFLRNNYVALFNLESDIFPKPTIIEQLMCYNKSVVGATYFSGLKERSYPMITDICKYNYYENVKCCGTPYLKGFFEMTDTFEPKPYFGQGLGCTLISRGIVQRVPFRSDPTKKSHYDTMFYCDLMQQGIQNYLVPIMCRHENQTWDKQLKLIEKLK